MGMFKRKRRTPSVTGKGKFTWASNAPDHWPQLVTIERPDADSNIWMVSLEIGATLVKLFEAAGCGCELKALAQNRFSPTGLLDVPFEVEDKGHYRSVLFYLESNERTAAIFNGTRKLLLDRGEPEPVYFAPDLLPSTDDITDPCRPFQADDLSVVDETPKGCAMWWAAREGERFHSSISQCKLLEAYEAMDGINTYLLAAIMRESGAVDDDKMGRVNLPDNMMTYPMKGPEDQLLLFSASAEKGLRFHFPIEDTTAEYRDNFWSAFAAYVSAWKREAIKRGFPLDPPPEDSSPLKWFKALCQVMAIEENKGKTMDKIGVVLSGT